MGRASGGSEGDANVSIGQAMLSVKQFFNDQLQLEATVTAVTPHQEGWRVLADAVVEDEYMRQRARRDIVATYEVLVGSDLAIRSFERKDLRERGTVQAHG